MFILNKKATDIIIIAEVFTSNLGYIRAVIDLNCLDKNSYLILIGKKYALQKPT